MDATSLAISIVGIALTVLLSYYGLRTLKLFKTNVAARAWTYISMGSVSFAIGLVLFTLEAVQPMGLLPVGGIVMTVGAVFLVIGLRKNYLFWASKDHFE
ncbi:hypothetical protein J2P12_02425 [Candidatus Bathyarchaeota archaeon]|nr:hypothetical protein [Candidatus Bathyarchaeota archaeon]